MECKADMGTAKIVHKSKDIVIVSCLCVCGNDRHGYAKTIYEDQFFAQFDETEAENV